MPKTIFANWKMNPETLAEAVTLAKTTGRANLVLCPPFVFIEEVAKVINESRLGAQDLFWEKGSGPFTGEISARELKDLGVEYVIIGHSERRQLGETNEVVAKKIKAAIQAGLIPILAVGETLAEKEAGKQEEVILEEIKTALEKISVPSYIYIAYEPIWAISTNKNSKADKPENTLEIIKFIKKNLKEINKEALEHVHFIYGGSINSKNAEKFLQHKEIEGALVGAASLDPAEIIKITEIASNS